MDQDRKSGRLAGKHCFVTGAAQGIGRSIALAFAAEGAQVVAADRQFTDPLEAVGVQPILLDVTDPDAVAAAARDHAGVDVLVNCVGLVSVGAVLEASLEDLDRAYAVNVRSMACTIQAFLPGMIERSNGAIINIASVVSSVMAAPARFAYATSKAAVIGLTMSVALDYVRQGVRCNAISPGTIETPSLHQRWAATGDVATARAAFVARQAMGRLGQPEEIAAAAVLLASDEAKFMTGGNLIIDGGMSL
ncbi:SDR family oxidoreductase [Caulobacter rhizosphaerae]|uniref:SDR family oxidoreductase n=1 Tax=Caulobacter rhizosphaerae TaxID=2010972 RepID=UPI0013D5C55A|nr:SDR family oxidoreductase [Caulobacter rhizosphaerae]